MIRFKEIFLGFGRPSSLVLQCSGRLHVWLLLTGYWRCLVATTRLQRCETRIYECSYLHVSTCDCDMIRLRVSHLGCDDELIV
jgi:hypothetical protein